MIDKYLVLSFGDEIIIKNKKYFVYEAFVTSGSADDPGYDNSDISGYDCNIITIPSIYYKADHRKNEQDDSKMLYFYLSNWPKSFDELSQAELIENIYM